MDCSLEAARSWPDTLRPVSVGGAWVVESEKPRVEVYRP